MNRSTAVGLVALAWTLAAALPHHRAAAQVSDDAPAAVAEPQSLADLAPEPIPDDENVAAQLDALEAPLQRWDQDYTQFSSTPLGLAYDEREDQGFPPTADEAAAIRAILDDHAELDAALRRAATGDKYASRADYSKTSGAFIDDLMPRIQRLRSASRFVAWQIRMASVEGRRDEAVMRGVELLRLARLHENEPTLVGYLVTLAVRNVAVRELYDALASGNVAFETHAALDAELALADNPAAITRVLRTERAFAITAESELGAPGAVNRLLSGGRTAGDYLAEVVKASEASWPEFRRQVQQGKWSKPSGYGPLADLLTPALEAATTAHGRQLAATRSLRAFNALRLYARFNQREATGLADVDLPAEAYADPYADGPLQARLTDDGWLIYSVMANEKDDGGDFRNLLDYGVTPPGERRAQ
jgi:hypothetical protein